MKSGVCEIWLVSIIRTDRKTKKKEQGNDIAET